MWTNWKRYFSGKPARTAGTGQEPADMGVDIGLEATLEPALPPLYDVMGTAAADRLSGPFGTDQRSVRPSAG